MRLSNNGGCEVVKEIVKVTRVNMDKKIKWRYEIKNKLIVFIYCLKLFFTLSHTIKLFYQIWLIYLMI